MRLKKPISEYPYEVDITGEAGNAYVLIGLAKKIAEEQEWREDAIEDLIERMKASDYENLVSQLDAAFGDVLVIYE